MLVTKAKAKRFGVTFGSEFMFVKADDESEAMRLAHLKFALPTRISTGTVPTCRPSFRPCTTKPRRPQRIFRPEPETKSKDG